VCVCVCVCRDTKTKVPVEDGPSSTESPDPAHVQPG